MEPYLRIKVEDFRHMEDIGCILMAIGASLAASFSLLVGGTIFAFGIVVFILFGWAKSKTESFLRNFYQESRRPPSSKTPKQGPLKQH